MQGWERRLLPRQQRVTLGSWSSSGRGKTMLKLRSLASDDVHLVRRGDEQALCGRFVTADWEEVADDTEVTCSVCRNDASSLQ